MNMIRTALTVTLIALAPVAAKAEEGPGFLYGGQTFEGQSLPPALRQKLFEMELELNEQRQQLFSQFVIDKYLEERAKAEGKTVEQLQSELLAMTPPDEAALRKFYEENKDRIPAEFDQVKDRLAQYLQQQQMQESVAALLERIRKERGYEVMLSEPEAPVFDVSTEGYPSKGAADADVTVIEFADFQCPYCKRATGAVDRLVKEYGDRVRVVYRDLPVNPSGISREVAEGGVCAAEQGRFWDYHDLAFEMQDALTAETPAALATELGLDTEAFTACLESDETAARVERSKAEATALGVSGTPAFFVNGRPVHVDADVGKALSEAVEKALDKES